MKLTPPKDVKSINVEGTEYTAVDGVVEIFDTRHIEAAKGEGFTEPAAVTKRATTGE